MLGRRTTARLTARLTLALLAPLALLAGCELIAGIDDKELGAGGAGGATATATAASTGTGAALPIPLCESVQPPCDSNCNPDNQSVDLMSLRQVVTDGRFLFFDGQNATGHAAIHYMDLADMVSGSAPAIDTTSLAPITALAVDCDNIYFSHPNGPVHSIFFAAGPNETVHTIADEGEPISSIVANDAVIAWVTDSEGGAVRLWDKSSSSVDSPVVLDVATEQPEPRGLAIDTATIYWSTTLASAPGGRAIKYASIELDAMGKRRTGTVVEGYGPSGLAVDDAWVYWIDIATAALMKAPKEGGDAQTLVGNLPPGPDGDVIAVDEAFVYWIEGDQFVRRASKTGMDTAEYVASESKLAWLAIDRAWVYVTVYGSGVSAVRSVPKPVPQ